MIVTAHSSMLDSSTSPALKPSIGFRVSSANGGGDSLSARRARCLRCKRRLPALPLATAPEARRHVQRVQRANLSRIWLATGSSPFSCFLSKRTA